MNPNIKHTAPIKIIFARPLESIPCRERVERSHCGSELGERGVRGEVGEVPLDGRPRGEPHEAILCSSSHYS